MSLISKLTTLGAAGVGGDSYWIFQENVSPTTAHAIYDIDTDTQNNIVFSGYMNVGSDRRGWVAKIDTDGALQWSKYLDGVSQSYTYGITTDSNDNVISTTMDFGNETFNTVSLDASGNENWKRKNGVTNKEHPESIACDVSDNVYSYGWSESWSNGRPDTLTLKHNSSGTLLFKLWSGDNTNSSIDLIKGFDIAEVPSTGYMAVCGQSDKRTTGSVYDAFIGKTAKSNGYPNFIRVLYHASGNSRCMGVAADSSGNIYGLIYQSSSGAYIAKYSSGGVFQWLKKITVSGSNNFVPGKAIAVDSNDNIFVAWGFYPDSPVMKLDSSGNILANIYISDGSYINFAALEIDGNDNVVVTGYGDGVSDFLVIKLPNDLTSVIGSYGSFTISAGSATSTTSSDLTSTSQSFNSSTSPNAGETFLDTTSTITTGNVSANETLTEM